MTDKERDVRENRDVQVTKEKHSDSGFVASTFIKYAAYIVILIIVLYFIVHYILPGFH